MKAVKAEKPMTPLSLVALFAGGSVLAYVVSCGVQVDMASYGDPNFAHVKAMQLMSQLEQNPKCTLLRESVAEVRRLAGGYGGYAYAGYAGNGNYSGYGGYAGGNPIYVPGYGGYSGSGRSTYPGYGGYPGRTVSWREIQAVYLNWDKRLGCGLKREILAAFALHP